MGPWGIPPLWNVPERWYRPIFIFFCFVSRRSYGEDISARTPPAPFLLALNKRLAQAGWRGKAGLDWAGTRVTTENSTNMTLPGSHEAHGTNLQVVVRSTAGVRKMDQINHREQGRVHGAEYEPGLVPAAIFHL